MMDSVQLFGGGICAALPRGMFSDISNLRQVPDNQEVFLCNASDIAVLIQ